MGSTGTGYIPPAEIPDYRTRQNSVSSTALVAIVVTGTILLAISIVFLGLWCSRRRAERKARTARGDTLSIEGDFSTLCERSGSRKLQKAVSSASVTDEATPRLRQWRSLPLLPRVFTGHFIRTSSSRHWPSSELVHTGRRNPSWIDEDGLHGPEMYSQPSGRGGGFWGAKMIRDSWPLGNRMPALPNLYQGHPYDRRLEEDALFGIDHVRTACGQLRMYSRVLPEPPKPAVGINHGRQHSRSQSAVSNGYQQHHELQRQNLGPAMVGGGSPVRSLPRTPSRQRGRQLSTDSTLSEILRSTEKRLQEGRTTARNTLMTSPDKMSTSRESLLDHSEPMDTRPLSRSLTAPRTPSPKKLVPSRSATLGHKRQTSEMSNTSESDSLLDELVLQMPEPDCPSGLTSPSRNPKREDPQLLPLNIKSARSSLSSALSTVYSEDERSEGIRTATHTPKGMAAEDIKAMMVSPESMADPFSPVSSMSLVMARPVTSHGWPGTQHRAQDLFRESLGRSQRLRRMTTLGQTLTLPPEVKLPPCPRRESQGVRGVVGGGYPDMKRQELVGSRPLYKTKAMSKIPVKTGVMSLGLNKIILPPPGSSILGPRELPSRIQHAGLDVHGMDSRTPKNGDFDTPGLTSCGPNRDPNQDTDHDDDPDADLRDSTSTIRLPSRISPIPQLHHSASVSSSIYSQDFDTVTSQITAIGPNTTITPKMTTTLNMASITNFNTNLLPSTPSPVRSLPTHTPTETGTLTPTRTPSPAKSTSFQQNTPVAVAVAVAELRRMNSCLSTVSATSNHTSHASDPSHVHHTSRGHGHGHARTESRNYLSLGEPSPSPPRQRRGSPGSGSRSHAGGVVFGGGTVISLGGSPRRRVGHARVASRRVSMSPVRYDIRQGSHQDHLYRDHSQGIEEKENPPSRDHRHHGNASNNQGGYKMPRVEFTFQLTGDDGDDGGARVLRPGSGGNIGPPSGIKRRRYEATNKGSQESLGLYDQEGFLISTPMRGVSPVRII